VTHVTHSDLLTHLTRDPLTHCRSSLRCTRGLAVREDSLPAPGPVYARDDDDVDVGGPDEIFPDEVASTTSPRCRE